MASAFATGHAFAEDTLIATDGVKTGTIEGYADGICRFDGAAIPRASIYYIGLDADMPPPQPQDPMRDEVHLHDGSVHRGPLVSIDNDNVVTESGVHRRIDVAWIWLTPMLGSQGQTAPPTPPEEPSTPLEEGGPAYEWEGTVAVENRYNGSEGRHLWRAEYRVRFLEVPGGLTPGRDGTDYPDAKVVPLDLAYEIHADQNWDRGSYSLMTNAAGVIINADVTMFGAASGRFTGDQMRDGGLYGNIVRILTPLPPRQEVPESLASPLDYSNYSDNVSQPVEPGWYVIYLGQFPHDSPQAWRAYYRGIDRGGRQPPFSDDPDEDFVHWIPDGMNGESIIGRLDDPDQAEVRGRHTFAQQGPGGPEDRLQIIIEWSFTRTRQ